MCGRDAWLPARRLPAPTPRPSAVSSIRRSACPRSDPRLCSSMATKLSPIVIAWRVLPNPRDCNFLDPASPAMRDCAAMLIRFSVENYLCFGSPVVLDLEGDRGVQRRPRSPAHRSDHRRTGEPASRRCCAPLACCTLTLAGPRRPADPANRFYGDRPTRLELVVELDAARFHYALSLTPSEILDEACIWKRATRAPTGEAQRRMIFERHRSGPGRPPVIELGEGLEGDAGRLRLVAQSTRPEQPILHEGLRRGLPLFVPLGIWLRDRLQLLLPEAKLVGLAARGARDPGFLEFLSEYLAVARLGIRRVGIERQPLPRVTSKAPRSKRKSPPSSRALPIASPRQPRAS